MRCRVDVKFNIIQIMQDIFEIVYYSGTGSTELVAKCFYRILAEKGFSGGIHRVSSELFTPEPHDFLVLVFPVHACNAPEAVYKWLENIPSVNKIPALAVSVSGGGEISPNTACRVSSIKRLEKKGYDVIYDEMIVMPSNVVVATKEALAIKLLEVLPVKAKIILDGFLSGTRHRSAPKLIDRIFSKLGELEKPFTKSFGKRIKVSSNCDGCGKCVSHCPAKNISLLSGKPVFGDKCHLCLGCLYLCPKKALAPGIWKFIVIKEGYDIDKLSKMAPLTTTLDVEKAAKGYIWSGVRKYLND